MLNGDDFGQLFKSFEHTAFRLEVRDRYDADYENESLRKFLAQEKDDLPWMQDWLTMIRDATSKGRRFTRVRVVSLPLTDYSRFGVWCSQFTNGAGEDIRYLTRDQANAENLPNHDYWLFDSNKLVRMHFDDSDAFLGGEVIEDAAEIVRHNYWRDAAWHRANRRDDFATEQRLGFV
ncbi:DUF6879 family protein [Streptomyces sp. NPDC056835]|uniref:DUF6879 family protein n=1 Tax=Streptomyces sp. NPDC056835 TaxID=3345956 RepID=UPI003682A326